MHHRFGVIQHFPGLSTAEREFTARLRAASARIAIECIELSPHGYELPNGRHRLSHRELDCVFSLHYSSPKTLDIYTLLALWNPWDYLWQFGYAEANNNILSYDDYLSCGSKAADDHIARLRSTARLPRKSPLTLHPSISEPFIEPHLCPQSIFYIGMNWERKHSKAGRHHDLLMLLDRENLVAIYGPDRQQGFSPWQGFNNYRGPLPFDGTSILKAINACGISLVLSSASHFRDGIGTSRIFESVAAGALVISDRNPFVTKNFADTVLYIPEGACPEEAATCIRRHVSWVKSHPVAARSMALAAQRILRERFLLSDQLREIYTVLPSRISRGRLVSRDSARPAALTVYFLVDHLNGDTFKLQCRNLESQYFHNFRSVFVFVTTRNVPKLESVGVALPLPPRGAETLTLPRFDESQLDGYKPSGRLLMEILEHDTMSARSDFVCFIEPHVELFANHIGELLKPLISDAPPELACSMKDQHRPQESDSTDAPKTAVADASCADFVVFPGHANHKARCCADVTLTQGQALASGMLTRFMFRTSVFTDFRVRHTLPHLTHLAPAWLFLWSRAEHVRRVTFTVQQNADSDIAATQRDLQRESAIIRDVSPEIADAHVLRSLLAQDRQTLIDWFRNGTADDYRQIFAMLVDSLPLPSAIRTLLVQPLQWWLKRRLRKL